jgi:hypothetical protein
MKLVMIYVALVILVFTAIIILDCPKAHAAKNPFTTTFGLVVNIDGVGKKVYTEPTPAGKRLALSPAFGSLSCVVSETNASGTNVMRALACTEDGSTVVFRTFVSCSAVKPSTDTSTMAISIGDDTAFFLMACETKKDETAKPAPVNPHSTDI